MYNLKSTETENLSSVQKAFAPIIINTLGIGHRIL